MLELLAKPGSERLRYSDIISKVGLAQATGHAILKSLCDRGWVRRDPVDKTFCLGPAFAMCAVRAEHARPLTHAARAVALDVSRSTGHAASVLERVGDMLVITAFEGGENRRLRDTLPGEKMPYAPPFGIAFAAWDSPQGQKSWIERSGATRPTLIKRYERILATTRARGFDVDVTTPALAQAAAMASALPRQDVPANMHQLIDRLLIECATTGFRSGDVSTDLAQTVASIAVPVFDAVGQAALIVCLHPLQSLRAPQVDSLGRALVQATEVLHARNALGNGASQG